MKYNQVGPGAQVVKNTIKQWVVKLMIKIAEYHKVGLICGLSDSVESGLQRVGYGYKSFFPS